MSDEPLTDFVSVRGGTPEEPRTEGDKLRSAASYCASYGIPLEDVKSRWESINEFRNSGGSGGNTVGHMEMVDWCERYWNDDPDGRRAAMRGEVRPKETRQQRRDRQRREEKHLAKMKTRLTQEHRGNFRPPPTSIDDFSRPGGFIKDWTKEDVDRSRRVWNLEEWSDQDLDAWVEMQREFPGGKWVDDHGPNTKRVYALSCLHLKDEDPAKYHRLIVEGEMWNTYGTEMGNPSA
jgi:hypothetical protein